MDFSEVAGVRVLPAMEEFPPFLSKTEAILLLSLTDCDILRGRSMKDKPTRLLLLRLPWGIAPTVPKPLRCRATFIRLNDHYVQ